MTKSARIEVFRPGTFTPLQGKPLSFSAADLKAIADGYDAQTAPAPIVVGHPSTDAPAFGWVKSFDYDPLEERLFANVDEIATEFADAVRAGRYKKVSLSFFRPNAAANPQPGTWYPKHVGFLGGAAPAVSGLKNVQFSDLGEDTPVIIAEFGHRGFEETASILRSLREFFIEKFGMEDADKALSSYRIDWLSETEIDPPRPDFAAPPTPPQKQEIPVTKPTHDAAAFATREAELAVREADIAERQRIADERDKQIAHQDNVAFAEGLVSAGKLIPAMSDKLVALLDHIPAAEVSFADGAKGNVATELRALFEAQPKVVDFSQVELGDPLKAASAAFAADGHTVDAEQLARHEAALTLQSKNPGLSYLDAVRAVS